MPEYRCHGCGGSFSVSIENEYGAYEFRRCPECGSGKTTFE